MVRYLLIFFAVLGFHVLPAFSAESLSKISLTKLEGILKKTKTPVVLMNTAKWCTYCPAVKKKLIEAQQKLGDAAAFYEWNWDDMEKWEKAHKPKIYPPFRIDMARSLPGVTLYLDGLTIGTLRGNARELDLSKWVMDQVADQKVVKLQRIDAQNIKDLFNISGKDIFVHFCGGAAMYCEENFDRMKALKKARPESTLVYRTWVRDEEYETDFKTMNNAGFGTEEIKYLGAYYVRDGKVRRFVEHDLVKEDLTTWLVKP
jgi:thiol-disulfide isomerase/thioredoxin